MKKIVYLIFITLLAACNSGPHQAKIDTLDSMRYELDTIRREFAKVDTAFMYARYDTIAVNLRRIKSSLRDTLTHHQAMFMSEYYQVRKPYQSLKISYGKFMEEAEYTASQLKDLAEALDKGSIDDAKVEEYFQLELSSAQTLHSFMQEKLNQLEQAGLQYDTLQPMILQFLEGAGVPDTTQ